MCIRDSDDDEDDDDDKEDVRKGHAVVVFDPDDGMRGGSSISGGLFKLGLFFVKPPDILLTPRVRRGHQA